MLSEWQDAKEQVRQAIDIVDLVGGYLTLRRQGRNYVGLCPWHDDSRPSLQVNPDRQSYKCWVCNLGGDVFSFLMQAEGLEFPEAFEQLAERAGIDLAALRGQKAPASQFDRRNLFAVMVWAERQFHNCLVQDPAAEGARDYLVGRGINADSTERFQLGYSPDRWDWLLQKAQLEGYSPELLERVGLVLARANGGFYDRFRGRLLFSIRDVRSRPIAFGGRILPGSESSDPDRREAKYINSPETPLFSKSEHLYALDLARTEASQHGLVVMEGYTDVIMAHQHGVHNAVAVLGTALGERHVPLIKRFTDKTTLVLDGDEAGQRRTLQIMDELLALFVKKEIDLRVLSLPSGGDPCDVILSQGSEAFRERLDESLDPLDFKINAVTNGLESAPGTHRAALAMEEIIGTLARAMPSSAQSSSSSLIREQQVLARLSRQFGIGDEAIQTRLSTVRAELKHKRISAERSQDSPQQEPQVPLKAWERELMELLIHHPEVFPRLVEQIDTQDVSHPGCRAIFAHAEALMHAGQVPTFDQLISAVEDAAWKNLLVDCDESGRGKSSNDTEQRVTDLLSLITAERQKLGYQEIVTGFHKKESLDPCHDDPLKKHFAERKRFQEQKHRQTGSAPTDG